MFCCFVFVALFVEVFVQSRTSDVSRYPKERKGDSERKMKKQK